MRKNSASGFTLIELMITVVILAILAAIAYPSYTNYITEARRSDATIALTQLAAQQEKFFTQCGGYADTIGPNPPGRVCPPAGAVVGGIIDTSTVPILPGGNTRDGFYNIQIAARPGGTMATGFVLTAMPLSSQLTRDNLKCTTIALDSTGVKSATGTDAVLGPNGGKCWKK
jgi:type IV pilus assembly protein PilE